MREKKNFILTLDNKKKIFLQEDIKLNRMTIMLRDKDSYMGRDSLYSLLLVEFYTIRVENLQKKCPNANNVKN